GPGPGPGAGGARAAAAAPPSPGRRRRRGRRGGRPAPRSPLLLGLEDVAHELRGLGHVAAGLALEVGEPRAHAGEVVASLGVRARGEGGQAVVETAHLPLLALL